MDFLVAEERTVMNKKKTMMKTRKKNRMLFQLQSTCCGDMVVKMAHSSATSAAKVTSTSTTMTLAMEDGRMRGSVSFSRPYTPE